MQPVRFASRATIRKSAEEIASEIADLGNWPAFRGYAFLPGIASAEYGSRTGDMVGSRIQVRNTDGSTHVEEVLAWDPPERILMKLHEFSPPLNRLADYFTEEWLFRESGDNTQVVRRFEMFPHSRMTRPLLWLISRFFKRAIDRHLEHLG